MIPRDYITVDPGRIIQAFSAYMDHGGHTITRAQFEENFEAKLRDRQFTADIGPLLAHGYLWDIEADAVSVSTELTVRLPGQPWKGEG